ncbi:MAG TPA: hypothetical protein VN986_07130, partial [Actinomycetota bacterium]|nr:hypothetical protein [Actinomycetota bacterium]
MREFQRGAMRLHVLHHAAAGEVHGAWLIEELARHGYRVSPGDPRRVSLATIAIEWGRIGVTGFGGPPAHIGLLRRLCVERR